MTQLNVTDCGKTVTFKRLMDKETMFCFLVLGSRRRPTIKTKNNKTELLNPEEGEDNVGDAVGKKNSKFFQSILIPAMSTMIVFS